jgi:ribosomal protein L37AE/L43A
MTGFGKGKFGGHKDREKNRLMIDTEIVNGQCPSCKADVIFVSLYRYVYRCSNCGIDVEQKVNGVISYIPATFPGQEIPSLKYIGDGPDKA